MARSRFETYQRNPYLSQFVETPLDAGLAMNTIQARQAYFDNIQKALAASNPQLEYLAPNQYDQGDIMAANQLMTQRGQAIQSITDDISKTDNLTDAARKIAALQNDPNYNQQVQALRNRKLQDEQFRKSLETNYGKDPFFNQFSDNYARSRYTPFSTTSSLNAPIGAPLPDLDKKIQTIGNLMESNAFTTADGSMIGKTADGQFFVTRKGKREFIDADEALKEMTAFVYNDPEVQNWAQTMQRIGINPNEMIMSKLAGAASAKAFTKSESEVDYMTDQFGLEDYKNKKKQAESQFNPVGAFASQSLAPLMVDESGNITVNSEDPEYKRLESEANVTRARGKAPSSESIKGDIEAQKAFNQYRRENLQKEVANIKAKYPNLAPEGIVNMINQAASGQLYKEQLVDPDTGNPIDAEPTPIQTFAGREIYEMTPTGPQRVNYEDIEEEVSGDDNTLGKGKVAKTGINIISNMPTPDPNRPDKEQYKMFSGTPFAVGNKQYIAKENSKSQEKRYQQFNQLFNIQYDLNKDYSSGVIDTDAGDLPMVSYRHVDEGGNIQTYAAPGKPNSDGTVTIYSQEGEIKVKPGSQEFIQIMLTNGATNDEVYKMIQR